MKTFLTLLQREWLQHRFGWTILALAPLVLALPLLSFAQIEIDIDTPDRMGAAYPVMLAMIAIVAGTLVTFAVLWVTSMILITGIARRDHNDRSVEFWLSLPTSHSQSLAAPLLMHLLVVPAAALLIGLAGGYLVSLVLVTRLVGFGAWLSLPWADVVPASLAAVMRVLAGLPLATLWLLPLTLAVVLFGAWFKRWGLPMLVAALGLGGLVLKYFFGQPMLFKAIGEMSAQAGQALLPTGREELAVNGANQVAAALQAVPSWVLGDFGHALRALASPLFLGGLVISAACFALLVDWRRRGA